MTKRRRLPRDRASITHKATVGGFSFYVTAGMYDDGSLGEVFVRGAGKEGSTVQGLLDSWATSVSLGLQYGIPLSDFARKFAHRRFEPFGETGDDEIGYAFSLIDYVTRWLSGRFCDEAVNAELREISLDMRRKIRLGR